jgi:uncharacterized protein (TIGR02266 family)
MSDGAARSATSPPPGGIEQRAHQRSELQVEVTLTSDSHFFVGLTNDISTGGIFVSTYRPLDVGAKLEIEFALPDGTIHVKGTVRWRRDSSEMAPGVGISFDDIDAEHMQLIERFCARRPPLYYDLDE